jgi:hypothetical protein
VKITSKKKGIAWSVETGFTPCYTKEFAVKGLRELSNRPNSIIKKRPFSFESIEKKWNNNKFHIS